MHRFSRRMLMATGMALPILTPVRASAIDSEWETSELYPLIEAFPDRPGDDDRSFNPIRGTHYLLWQQSGAMPDTYWDPFGMDIGLLFGLTSNDLRAVVSQPGTSPLQVWRHMADSHGHLVARQSLLDQGWEVVQEEPYPRLTYSGSDTERAALAEEMAMLSQEIRDGGYDHIAFPDDITIVIGADANVVGLAAGMLFNRTSMTSVKYRLGNLNYLLPVQTYDFVWMPPTDLPVSGAESTFSSKWIDEENVTWQSIAVSLDSPDDVEEFVATVGSRLQTERSHLYPDQVFADFLELTQVKQEYASVRFDFAVTDSAWDCVVAIQTGDLGFLPPPE